MNLYERKNLCPPVYKCWWEMLIKWILWHGKALNPHTKKKKNNNNNKNNDDKKIYI